MRTDILILVITALGFSAFLWWLAHRWHPKRKRWCVMFYMTSYTPSASHVRTPDAETGYPAGSSAATLLDNKLTQVVQTLGVLPCATTTGIAAEPAWDDVYIAYRAVWDNPATPPEARVVRPESSAPLIDYFTGTNDVDFDLRSDLTADVTEFFSWVYDNCPADRYAVCFWGHAMGPGGLFYQSEPPIVVRPIYVLFLKVVRKIIGRNRWSGVIGLRGLQKALRVVVEKRTKELKRGGPVRPRGALNFASPSPLVLPPPVQPVPKVEIVLFQDCWMSGIETMFELQDDVRFIIASQSLVPVGLAVDGSGAPGAVWPYKKLIDALLTKQNFATDMMNILETFFNDPGTNTPPEFPNRYPAKKVLFSLLDCDVTAGAVSFAIGGEFRTLVTALYELTTNLRFQLIDYSDSTAGRLYEFSASTGLLEAGDQALIDLLEMCSYFKTPTRWPALGLATSVQQAIVNAATALEPKIKALVKQTFEAPPRPTGSLPYAGLTALYRTKSPVASDLFIEGTVRLGYEHLRFSTETKVVPPPVTTAGTGECSWTRYAYEQNSLTY